MEQFWKWLMKMDARGIFVISVVLFLAAGTWSALTIVRADEKPVEVAPVPGRPADLTLRPYQPVGVIGFVSNQFAADTLVLPINPFHPTFEEIIRSIVAKGGGRLAIPGRAGQIVAPRDQKTAAGQPGAARGPQSGGHGQGAAGAQGRPGAAAQGRPATGGRTPGTVRGTASRPAPTIAFKGMMQRPDGQFAAYVHDSEKGPSFVVVGDKIRNAKVVESGKDGVELEFPNGLRVSLGLGDPPWVIGAEGKE